MDGEATDDPRRILRVVRAAKVRGTSQRKGGHVVVGRLLVARMHGDPVELRVERLREFARRCAKMQPLFDK